MTKNKNLQDKLKALNTLYFVHNSKKTLLVLLASLFLSCSFSFLLHHGFGLGELFSLGGGFAFFLVFSVLDLRRIEKRKEVTLKDFALYFEVSSSQKQEQYFEAYQTDRDLNTVEISKLNTALKQRKEECSEGLSFLKQKALFSFLLFLISACLLTHFDQGLSPFSQMNQIKLSPHVTLEVVRGAQPGLTQKWYPLNHGVEDKIFLQKDNLVKVRFEASYKNEMKDQGNVLLLDGNGEVFQSFSFEPFEERSSLREVTFSLEKSLALSLPAFREGEVLARFEVEHGVKPKVFIRPEEEIEDPWPSNKALSLLIDVNSRENITLLTLHLELGDKVHSNKIREFRSEAVKEVSTTETIFFDNYMTQDHAQVTLVIGAVDASSPNPERGFSNQITLNLVSVYGQYRKALMTLKKMRGVLSKVEAGDEDIDLKNLPSKMEEVSRLSQGTPYFDSIDRAHLNQIERQLNTFLSQKNQGTLRKLTKKMVDFLDEHEAIDDRERDRDFFVAARALARSLANKQREEVTRISFEMKSFIEARYSRWLERVSKLMTLEDVPTWSKIRDEKPFRTALNKISGAQDYEEGNRLLSELVKDYESWLTELEAAEDKSQQEQEKLAEEQMVSIRKTLEELQRTQEQISLELDESEKKSTEQHENHWSLTRSKQNSNLAQMDELTERLSALNVDAGERLGKAGESMKSVVEKGEGKDFMAAERSSDQAGRYLRESLSKSQQQQKKRSGRRRRRQAGSDRYYGQSVHSGDIKIRHDYEIDRAYREDILDEVERDPQGESEELLRNYLKRIVR